MGVGLVCTSNHCMLYSSQVGFIQWLLAQTRPTPIFYLLWTTNLKYTVYCAFQNSRELRQRPLKALSIGQLTKDFV